MRVERSARHSARRASEALAQGPAVALTRTRIGLTALGFLGNSDTMQATAARAVMITARDSDAYVASDMPAGLQANWSLTSAQRRRSGA
jgi:hypothetical protein